MDTIAERLALKRRDRVREALLSAIRSMTFDTLTDDELRSARDRNAALRRAARAKGYEWDASVHAVTRDRLAEVLAERRATS